MAWVADRSHIATHHLAKLARYCQTQTSAAELPSGGGIGLCEFLEQAGELLLGHADAAIRDCKFNPLASASRAYVKPANGPSLPW